MATSGPGPGSEFSRDPPDCVLTTPESLEVMLVSRNVDSQNIRGNVPAVIVDEIHAFAGDDRGWHLLSVLERVALGRPQDSEDRPFGDRR